MRATAAKALGTLVERLGEAHFPDVVPGLLRTLKTDTSGVDRQVPSEYRQGRFHVSPRISTGYLQALDPNHIYRKSYPPVLSGLSDMEEYIREAAMRAGRMIVT
ncbi:uncharacterized protein F5147DRAFT_782319 [Suillus discolor]|uniref:Uncharacterized protein n=1 Tax=Suillus discolor TaxID=1912936 RepID=A0A9P7ES69_9AGAM|nr:uncharacterized protein F5147DRAFT_782319 [Suillus discolor]KAG2084814.1 hypothetical protein F5147DRAFT_782319 [Suillus discolor]